MNARIVLLTAVVCAPRLARAGDLKVAVVPGVAVNLDAARVDALGQDLAQALSAALEVDAVGGLEVRRELPVAGVAPDCVTRPACVADVAKRTGAAQLLFVVMVDSGSSVQIDSTWVDVATGRHAARPAIDLTSSLDTDAKAKFQAAARQLLPDAPARPPPDIGVTIKTTMSKPTPRHLTPPAYITGAAAIAGLGTGIAFGLVTRSKYNRCDAAPDRCSESERASIRHWGLAADAGFLVAVGAAIATTVLYATSAEGPHVIVAPGPTGVGVSAIGRF